MSLNNIKISELNKINLSSVSSDDFFPLVDSGSLTTYRLDFNDFGTYFFASGSSRSASYANTASYAITSSYTFQAEDSFYAEAAVTADRATTLVWPNNASAHFATESLYATHSVSSSYALTASYSFSSSFATTASFALDGGAGIISGGSYNISCSYASASMSASYALSASKAESASYAFSASNAETASYALAAPEANLLSHPGIAAAWALVCGTASLVYTPGERTMYNPAVLSGYNIRDDIEYLGETLVPSADPGDKPFGFFGSSLPLKIWGVKFATPMSHTNYTVLTGLGGEQGQEYIGLTVFPKQIKSIYGFTMSLNLYDTRGGEFDSYIDPIESDWFNFVVYANPSNVTNENGAIYTGPPGQKGDKGDKGDTGGSNGGPTFLDMPILVAGGPIYGSLGPGGVPYPGENPTIGPILDNFYFKKSRFVNNLSSPGNGYSYTFNINTTIQTFYLSSIDDKTFPTTINGVILECFGYSSFYTGVQFCIRKNSTSQWLTFSLPPNGYNGNTVPVNISAQGSFPLNSDLSFQFKIGTPMSTGVMNIGSAPIFLRVIGYY